MGGAKDVWHILLAVTLIGGIVCTALWVMQFFSVQILMLKTNIYKNKLNERKKITNAKT